MRTIFFLLFFVAMIPHFCFAQQSGRRNNLLIYPSGTIINDRIKAPAGYTRVKETSGSFADYLRNLKLKPDGAQVHYFDGRIKDNNGIYVAVVDLNIGNKDLQQCADVIMHVRAEYLWYHHFEDKIHFTLTNGFHADYSKWKEGYRISIAGNKTKWVKTAVPGNSFNSFCQYMDIIYNYCGTLSLSKELKKVDFKNMQPGDILIKGGSPGHAELVMDMAMNNDGKKIFLLSQSYMPAQEMQILQNPLSPGLSPWYLLNPDDAKVVTPQWEFTTGQLMRFEENF